MRNLIIIVGLLLPMMAAADEWTRHFVRDEFDGTKDVYATDMDGDGDIDVLGCAYYDGEIVWWENANGDGLDWIEHPVDGTFEGPNSVYAKDIDGDDDLDVVCASLRSVTWWENLDGTGLEWSEHTIDGEVIWARSVYAMDMDGDGDIDVLGAMSTDDIITWWENVDGAGLNWAEHIVDDYYSDAYSIYATDVDGDGDNDVIGAANAGSEITWWENLDESGLEWSEHTVATDYIHPRCVHADDVDGDGDKDILSSSSTDDRITWWENVDGIGWNWVEHRINDEFAHGASSVYTADVDEDGDMDVLSAGLDYHITWWVNVNGDGLTWDEYVIDSLAGDVRSIYAEDVDGDDDLDVLGAAYYRDEIVWWENPCPNTLELAPWIEPVNISPNGGSFLYTFTFNNYSFLNITVDVWVEAILPNENIYPVFQTTVFFHADNTFRCMLQQNVPGYAPDGTYQYVANLGQYPDDIHLTDSFEFTKLSSGIAAQNVDSWSLSGWNDEINILETVATTPTSYALEPVFPNPFNPTTTISIRLPDTSDLSVIVYNVAGQQVAELANGPFNAGVHTLTFDATGLSSGIYFVHANVPGEMNEMRKIVLMK
jgi:FG-GAP-like repeat/Secretion system C-terminal sorting domain